MRENECRNAEIGCVACKRQLADVIIDYLTPVWERRRTLETDPGALDDILDRGAARARSVAAATLAEVREAMKI